VKYYNIRCLASLLAGLVTHQVGSLADFTSVQEMCK
jgi:hypothetical protein